MTIVIELPWPPSSNTYWRRNGNRYFISNKGQSYRETVGWNCIKYRGYFNRSERLRMSIDAYPPDKRRRDLDNLLKSLQDSLQHATIFDDDSQIDELYIRRMPEILGKIRVMIERIN